MVLVFGLKKTRWWLCVFDGYTNTFLVFVVGHTVLPGLGVFCGFLYISDKGI